MNLTKSNVDKQILNEYTQKLFNCYNDVNAMQHFFNYLFTFDISNDVYIRNGYKIKQKRYLEPKQHFIYDVLYKIVKTRNSVVNNELYRLFEKYSIKKGYNMHLNMKIKKFNLYIQEVLSAGNNKYTCQYRTTEKRGIKFLNGAVHHLETLLKSWGYNDDDLLNILDKPKDQT